MSVIVPLDVPSASTLAPIIGSPWLSTTVPFIVLCCCTTSMAAEAVCNPHAGAKVAIVKTERQVRLSPL